VGRQWLAFDLDGPEPGAVLHTVLHRVPRSRWVNLQVAAALVARGVPYVGLGKVDAA
jgi:hypothetical protein